MCEQLSLLPLMHQFDKNGWIIRTTYWESGFYKDFDYYVVFNKEKYSLFISKMQVEDWLYETLESETVIITRGSYNGKDDCFEIMFLDETGTTRHTMILQGNQFERVTPLVEGWHSAFDIYLGGFVYHKQDFYKVYYREADTLPCGKPVEE